LQLGLVRFCSVLRADELRLISGEEREQARIRGSAPSWWCSLEEPLFQREMQVLR